MRCSNCNTENPEGNSFCEACGMQLSRPCPECGTRNSPTARFCGACGVFVGTTQGERKRATIMFADIAGSTELISGLDPEQALERLRPAVEAMCAAVQKYDGTVVRAMGDGIMAAFGVPRAQEGHALLACEAALTMQAAFPVQPGKPAIRIGLHTGEVVSSVLVADPTREQGAHGLTVHLASRLSGFAEPGGICLTENCYQLVRPYCEVRSLGRRAARGFPEPIEIFGLLGLKPAVASQQFLGAHLTTFRGRASELDMLRHAVSSTETYSANVIGISGAPGAGKSRLCYEFAEWCRSRLIPVLEARAQIYGHATPLQPVLEFLRLLFQISRGDDSDLARRRIIERVLAIAPTFEADLPVIFEFLGVASGDGPPSLLLPKARRARLLDIVRHMVRQVGGEISVIIVEDLHWLDEASEDFVLTVVDAVAGTRALLVLNYRPSYSAPWMTSSNFHEISLSELGPEETSGLVEELLGSRPELRDIRQQVAIRSGGNPFFAEELVRSLIENGVLLGYAGVYSLGRRNGENSLPATVEAVIGARIDRLAQSEKTVLQIGAIIGKEFPLVVLQHVVGRLATNVESVLSRLCEIEMLQDQTIGDTRQFAFRHPLIQEVAYMTQLKARRSALHASVARAMKSYYWDRLDEFAGLIAYHHEEAGQLGDAASFSARAAKWVGSTVPAQAIKHWEKVRRLMQDQPMSHADDALRIMASSQIAWLGWREGMTAEEATPYIAEALRWAREADDTMVPMLLFVDGRITVASGGSADTYVDRVKEALSLVKKGHHAGRMATLNCALSQAYGWAGLLNEALIANDAAIEGASDVEHFDHQFLGYRVSHWAVSLRGRILVRLGRFGEADSCFQDMLRIEDKLLDPTLQFIPHLGYVDLAWCRGDADLAKRHAARVAEIADRSGTAYLRVYAFACSGTAKGLAGDYAGAAQDFVEGLAFVRTARASLGYEPELFASLADCHLQMGQPDLAVLAAKKAIDAARQRNTRLAECRASIIFAAALMAERGTTARSEAAELLKRAEALIERTGAVIYQPFLQRNRASTLV